jgi:hypothetical protein
LNPPLCHGGDDLYVEYFDSNLMVMVRVIWVADVPQPGVSSCSMLSIYVYQNPEFPPPYFVGGGDEASAVHDCSEYVLRLVFSSCVDHSWLDNVVKFDSAPLN